MAIELKYSVSNYTDRNGETKQALNYYVEHPDIGIKLQLKPNDYTGREILESLAKAGLISKGGE